VFVNRKNCIFANQRARRTQPTAAHGARAFQVCVEVAERRELAGVDRGARGAGLAARVEIAAAKEVGRRNHGGAHGAVFVGALRPRHLGVEPQIEAIGFILSSRR